MNLFMLESELVEHLSCLSKSQARLDRISDKAVFCWTCIEFCSLRQFHYLVHRCRLLLVLHMIRRFLLLDGRHLAIQAAVVGLD